MGAFRYEAEKRNIKFALQCAAPVEAYIDRSQFDKVISNLLSNAFKFTDDGGEITLVVEECQGKAVIRCLDTGLGLKPGDEKLVFNRFYQAKDANKKHNGSGIGLHLCRLIAEMHSGTIACANRTDRRGAEFTVTIPTGCLHLAPESIVEPKPRMDTQKAGVKGRVLLVDDDIEITDYIIEELSGDLEFTACRNGKQAIGELLSNKYDAVVTDIMMPEMDGFTLLRLIRQNACISGIPVILLTSESEASTRLQVLGDGADAFMPKPFIMDELKIRLCNLIERHGRIRQQIAGQEAVAENIDDIQVADTDKQLLDRVMKCINERLSDSDLDIDTLCREVGISRMHLHRKMKELTGLAPAEFIRNLRLEQAARLLREKHANISQVAYSLGFTSPQHFSRVFKKHFGQSPSEFIDAAD